MKLPSFLVVLYSLVGQQAAELCGNTTELGLSQLTVYNVSVDPEEILKGPLFQLGNFDECLSIQGRQHCIARVRLHTSNKSSPLSSMVQASLAGWTSFPRDELIVGLCVPSACNSSSTQLAFSKKLAPAANQLGVETTVHIEPSYCQKVEQARTTAGDYVMSTLVVIAVTLLGVATLYEVSVLVQKQAKIGNSLVVQIVMCFSLINNWKRLWVLSNTSNTKHLRFIQGIRFITIYLEITGHATYAMFIAAHDNSEWLEQRYGDVLSTFLFNGHMGLCTFLVTGGFLLGYTGMAHLEENGFTFLLYLKSIGLRYARLTPALATVVAIAANWLKYFGSGPLWPFYGLVEVNNCNHHWWINLLYLQNYFFVETPCMLPLWYLAADYQNFVVFVFLLGLVYKHPRWAKTIFASTLAVFIFIPFMQTYLEQLDPTVLTVPRNIKNITYNSAYVRNYVTFHHNAAPYLIGMIYGYMYYTLSTKAVQFSKVFVAIFWVVTLTLPWGIILSGYFFYQPSYEYNVYIASLYAAFSRPLYACGIGLILFGFSSGIGWAANTMLSWRPFQVLGRLTYCTYLVHLLVLVAEYSSMRHPFHVSSRFLVRQTIADVLLSMLSGLALCLCVELPTSAILKLINTYSSKAMEPALPGVPTVSEKTEDVYLTYSSERL